MKPTFAGLQSCQPSGHESSTLETIFFPAFFQQCVLPSLAAACNLQSDLAELLSVGLRWLHRGLPTGRKRTGTRRYVIEARCARHERPFSGQHKSDVCGHNYPGLFLAAVPRSLGRFIMTETNKQVCGCHLPVCFICFFIHPPRHLFMQRYLAQTDWEWVLSSSCVCFGMSVNSPGIRKVHPLLLLLCFSEGET